MPPGLDMGANTLSSLEEPHRQAATDEMRGRRKPDGTAADHGNRQIVSLRHLVQLGHLVLLR
jgi:hypothetical protein